MTQVLDIEQPNGAIFSPDGVYRYKLWRTFLLGEGTVLFVCLNASKADAKISDPTVTRCIHYAQRWGFLKYFMANIFGLKSTDPGELYKADDPVGPDNDAAILEMAEESDLIIMAFGNHGLYRNRGAEVIQLLKGYKLHYLGDFTKEGCPRHPLYLRGDLEPKEFPQTCGIVSNLVQGGTK
jgi:hypothetical protein